VARKSAVESDAVKPLRNSMESLDPVLKLIFMQMRLKKVAFPSVLMIRDGSSSSSSSYSSSAFF
jgi:hypothetical protein